MASNNITENISWTYTLVATAPASASGAKTVASTANQKISQTGSRVASNVAQATTSPAAIDIGALGGGTLGRFAIKNLDGTNNLTVLTQVSSGVAIITLLPGELAVGRFGSGITAPAVESSASTLFYEYAIAEA